MIIKDKVEKVDDNWRLMLYDTDKDGQCLPEYKKSDSLEDINIYYVQQAQRLEGLIRRLTANEISPIRFFADYHRLSAGDIAARAGLTALTVKKHMEPKGFSKARVEALQRYARVFNISVCDFFFFLHLPAELSVEVTRYNERLAQKITVTAQAAGTEGTK